MYCVVNYEKIKKDILSILKENGFKKIRFKDNDDFGAPITISFEDKHDSDNNWDYFNRKLNESEKSIDKTNLIVSKEKNTNNVKCVFKIERNEINESIIVSDLIDLYNAFQRKFFLVNPVRKSFSILVKPTHRCNLDCKYCYDKPFRKIIHNDMTLETAEKILSVLSKYTEKVVWIWHGGEFTMVNMDWYKEFYTKVVPKYPMIDICFECMSNGINIDEKWIDFLQENETSLGVSFSAFFQTEFRCASQCINKTIDNDKYSQKIESMFKIAKAKGKAPGVIDVITKENAPKLIQLYEYYKEKKITPCFNFIFHTPESEKNKLEANAKEYVDHFLRYFNYWLYDENGVYERTVYSFLSMVIGVQETCCTNSECRKHWVAINPNGTMYPCDRYYPEKYILGNVHDVENGFDEIFENDKYQIYYNEIEDKFKNYCKKCDYFFACNGGCHGSSLESGGNCAGVEEFYCEVFKNFFDGIYNSIRKLDWLNEKINPYARKLFETNQFININRLNEYLQKKNIKYDLVYDPEKLIKCSEFEIINNINQTQRRTCGIARCKKNDYPIERDSYLEEEKRLIREQQEKDLDEFLLLKAKEYYNEEKLST